MSGEAKVVVAMERVPVFRRAPGPMFARASNQTADEATTTLEWKARVIVTVLAAPKVACVEAVAQHEDGRVAVACALRLCADALLAPPGG